MYEEEESAKRRRIGEPDTRKEKLAKRRGRLDPKFCGADGANRGVAERDSRDIAEEEEAKTSRDEAMARKVSMYDKLVSGEGGVQTGDGAKLDGGSFLIDFFAKSGPSTQANNTVAMNDHTPWTGAGGTRAIGQLDLVSHDMGMEAERQEWEAERLNEGAAEQARQEKVDMLKSLSADTAGARQKKLNVKQQREAERAEKSRKSTL